MRTVPFNKSAVTAEAPAASQIPVKPFEESIVPDLSDVIRRPAVKHETQPATEATPVTETSLETPGSTFTATEPEQVKETAQKMREKLEEELKTITEDPKRSARNVLKFINLARFILYPWIYKKILFEPREAEDLDKTLDAAAKLQEAGKPLTELNAWQRKIYDKYQSFDEHKKKVLWNESELDQIVDIAYLKLAEIKFLQWLIQNEWALVIVVIESKRFVPVVGERMGIKGLDLSFI